MDFFDCHVFYGAERTKQLFPPVHSAAELCRALERSGISRAVAYRLEQYLADPALGNRLLAEDLSANPNLFGLWAITPVETGEIPGPDEILPEMKQSRIVGFRLFPGGLRFLPRVFVLREWLELAVRQRIPLFVSTEHGCSLDALADLLTSFPDLIVVLTDSNVWPGDRLLRPFVRRFAHVYLDMSYMITSGGIADFVARYGPARLLFGSAFPRTGCGANLLMLRHAEISDAAKSAIAGGNLARIIGEVRYD
jgi:predicted TIM-barrel fold metal-dependent hydrolase